MLLGSAIGQGVGRLFRLHSTVSTLPQPRARGIQLTVADPSSTAPRSGTWVRYQIGKSSRSNIYCLFRRRRRAYLNTYKSRGYRVRPPQLYRYCVHRKQPAEQPPHFLPPRRFTKPALVCETITALPRNSRRNRQPKETRWYRGLLKHEGNMDKKTAKKGVCDRARVASW